MEFEKSNQLPWIAFHDPQVSFVNSCYDACWCFSQFIMVCVIMVFSALKSRKIGEILEIMTTFFTNISKKKKKSRKISSLVHHFNPKYQVYQLFSALAHLYFIRGFLWKWGLDSSDENIQTEANPSISLFCKLTG